MKRIKKHIISILAAVVLVLALTSCGEIRIDIAMDDDTLLQVGAAKCSMQEAVFRILEERELYEAMDSEMIWKRDINGETMADYIKNSVENEMIRNTTCLLMSDDEAKYLSEEDEAEAKEKAKAAYDRLKAKYDLSKYGITLENVESLYHKKAVYEMLYNESESDIKMDISESDTKVIKVNYLFLPIEVPYNDADAIRKSVLAGEDFEYVCEQAGYTPELNKVIVKGDMPESFERVAYALYDGEMSEVVEDGKNGYYLIQCVEDYMVAESVANNNKVISEAKKEIFDKKYSEYTKGKKLQFNNVEWDKIEIESL